MKPNDFDSYVGIPWCDGGRTRAGVDCWGLFRLVYSEVFGIELASYSDQYTTALDKTVIRELVNGGKDRWERVDQPNPGDGILLNIANRVHIGIAIGSGYMLHIEKGSGSIIESYNSLKMQNALEGYYRYTQ